MFEQTALRLPLVLGLAWSTFIVPDPAAAQSHGAGLRTDLEAAVEELDDSGQRLLDAYMQAYATSDTESPTYTHGRIVMAQLLEARREAMWAIRVLQIYSWDAASREQAAAFRDAVRTVQQETLRSVEVLDELEVEPGVSRVVIDEGERIKTILLRMAEVLRIAAEPPSRPSP